MLTDRQLKKVVRFRVQIWYEKVGKHWTDEQWLQYLRGQAGEQAK